MSFWVRPDFNYTVCTGSDHLSRLDGVVFGPGDHFIVNPRRRVRLQDGRLTSTGGRRESVNSRKGYGHSPKRSLNAHVEKVPSPDRTTFVSADDASFVETETCPTPIGRVDVTFEVIQQFPRGPVHQPNVRVQRRGQI